MRKFIFLFVLCGLISGQAWGDCFTLGTKRYCCAADNSSTTIGLASSKYYQVLGSATDHVKMKTPNRRIYCYSGGSITVQEPNWCDGTLFKRSDVENAVYYLDSVNSAYKLETQDLNGSADGFAVNDACLYAGCKAGYIKAGDSKCLSKDEVAICKESNIEFQAGTTGAKKGQKLETGGHVFVYCFKSDDIDNLELQVEHQRNICLPGRDAVKDKDDPKGYFSCGTDGKWHKETYPKCGGADECTEGQEGCIAKTYKNSDNQQLTEAENIGQVWRIDTGSSVCIKWECNPATHVKSENKCITKAQAQTNRDNANRAARTAQENKNACQNSGGTWASNKCTCSAPNVSLSGNSCVCNSGYEWNTDKKQGCKLTDKEALKAACNAAPAGTATWNDAAGACVCTNADQTFDMATRMCKDNADFAACKPLVDRGVATWNSGAKQCVCNQPGYIVQNNNCIESPEAAAERERREKEAAERARAEALRKSRRNISDAHGILVGMRETFKASVWKDEEGKFNTSRLVSDSIAGVVLGTVGGVVTSNVVKKNQVENGFEDIKCTVGGQTVADWGDEFRVG
ncbi:MAG: hypothetical protein Q4C08_04650, partial [Pseudomonadota bacterium]|nr:hypothetical protein [Pseudomonadota bacterium]